MSAICAGCSARLPSPSSWASAINARWRSLSSTRKRRSHGPARPVNVLPHYLDSMLGRDDDLAKVTALLGENRVVTLLGPGGIGKTRLAVELGRRLIPRFPGGVKLIDLAPVKEPAGVAGAVASALGVTQRSSEAPIEAIAKRLGKQPCLLIL